MPICTRCSCNANEHVPHHATKSVTACHIRSCNARSHDCVLCGTRQSTLALFAMTATWHEPHGPLAQQQLGISKVAYLYNCSKISRARSIDREDNAGRCKLLLLLLGAAGALALKEPCRCCCFNCCCSCCCSCWCCCPSRRWGLRSCMRLSISSGHSSGGCRGTKEGKREKAAFWTGGRVPA